MKKITAMLTAILLIMLVTMIPVSAAASDAPAEDTVAAVETEKNENDVLSAKAIAAAVVVAVVGAAGAIGMAVAISKTTESMARQPEIASKINSTMMLGVVFIETAIIYALIVAILIIFVL